MTKCNHIHNWSRTVTKWISTLDSKWDTCSRKHSPHNPKSNSTH